MSTSRFMKFIYQDLDTVFVQIMTPDKKEFEQVNTLVTIKAIHITVVIDVDITQKVACLESWCGKYDVRMFSACLAFLHHEYADIEFRIIDAFYKECGDGVKVPLSYYYIANYFTTWLEANFDAKPCLRKNVYDINKQNFKSFMLGPKPLFNDFYETYVAHETNVPSMIKQNGKGNVLKQRLADLYKYSKNLQEFVQKVDRCDCTMYCQWLTRLVNAYFVGLLFKTWVIDIAAKSPIQHLHIELEPMNKDQCVSFMETYVTYNRKSCDV